MKPQSMSDTRFFRELCQLLGLDVQESDEDTVITAVKQLQDELSYAERASEINFLEWQKLADRQV